MNEYLQDRVARIASAASSQYRFLLAGGKALQVHGLSLRPTQDVDLFTDSHDPDQFHAAYEAILAALNAEGLRVETHVYQQGFARFLVIARETHETVEVDLGIDWRADKEGEQFAAGNVLSERDAVVNKTLAVFGRGYARDFIDLYNILSTRKYSYDDLLRLAPEHDPGFDQRYFAQSLLGVQRFTVEAVSHYGLDSEDWAHVIKCMVDFATYISDSPPFPPA